MCYGLCYIRRFAPQLFLFSLVSPFHNKEVYGSEANSSSFAFAVSEWQKVFSSGQGHTILFKNKFVVFKCSKRLEVLNFQLHQDAGMPVRGQPCAAPLSCCGDAGAGRCNLDPKTYLVASYEQQYFQGTDPFFSSCLFL